MAILTMIRHRFWNNDGTPASGAKVYTYDAGTTTPKATYSDSTESTPNANPVICNSKGECDLWTSGLYKINVLQSDNVQITGYPVDNIGSAATASAGSTYTYVATVGGTANAITLTPSTPITSYVTGAKYSFITGASANTAAVSVSISGLTTKAVQRNGLALGANDLPASSLIDIEYDGTAFQMCVSQSASVIAVQDGSFVWCGTAGGTANALTLTPSPAITAYKAGRKFRFKSGASANTTATTIQISGLATPRAIQKQGAALIGGEIASNSWYEVLDDGTAFQLSGAFNAAQSASYQVFTGNGTWTKPVGLTGNELAVVELWGAGGGGNSTGYGGGGGAYMRGQYKVSLLGATESVTIGTGGAAGVAGGNSAFGSWLIAYGGGPGSATQGGGGGGGRGAGGTPTGGIGYANNTGAALGANATGDCGAGGGNNTTSGGSADWGGGAGSGSGYVGGNSLYGGGGGTDSAVVSLSRFGGAGGKNDTAPTTPGGGGCGNTGIPANCVGARGECRVWVILS